MKIVLLLWSLIASVVAWGHHSYAMFDGSKRLTVEGTVAKLEWANPHVFVWVYVRRTESTSFDLYGFSTASVNVLARNGWSASTLKAGEKVAVEYWPLRDGRTGGQLIKVTQEDGRVTRGIGGPTGVDTSRGSVDAK